MTTLPEHNAWSKSSYSSSETACVEISHAATNALLRDTKAREHGHLELPPVTWQSLVSRL